MPLRDDQATLRQMPAHAREALALVHEQCPLRPRVARQLFSQIPPSAAIFPARFSSQIAMNH
jgi:hypothetical protein